jgi:acetoin utilization deacetylase AcuC-like enzyme
MKLVWSEAFRQVYARDPAAAAGRLDGVVETLQGSVEWVEPSPAPEEALLRCHGPGHLEWVRREGVYEIAALAAGAAMRAAEIGREEPAFALIRPPGHHASHDHAWGFCYFNNLAVALSHLRAAGRAEDAFVLDFDLHFGDGTVDILGREDWVGILNPDQPGRDAYLRQVANALEDFEGDAIAVSAGFDNHEADWGGLLLTEDYRLMGLDVGIRARALGSACFGVLEGGYNHAVLGENVRAFLHGLEQGWTKGASGRLDRR